jgi:hypothetical protein
MNKPLIVALFATALLSTGCDPKFWNFAYMPNPWRETGRFD